MSNTARCVLRFVRQAQHLYRRRTSVPRPLLAPFKQLHQAFSTSRPDSHAYATSGTQTTPTATPPALVLPEFNLTNHTILVTGAARGLGLSMADALLSAGATVYALDRLPPSSQSPEFSKIQSHASANLPGSLHYRQIDVRDVPALNGTVASIADTEGRLDGLIAAAGIQQETPAIDYSQEDAQRMFETNVVGVMMTAQATAKQMMKFGKGGSMAFIASMSATVANRGLPCSAYNSSKAAVVQLARNLAAEWGQEGIRVNTISPG